MRDLTRGSIVKNLVTFSVPLFLGNFLQMLYNMVDTAWVGRLGRFALASVSMSFSVMFVLIAAGIGLTQGTTTMVSQYLGAKRHDMVRKTIANSLFFMGALSVVISVLGVVFARPLLLLLGCPRDILAPAMAYLQIIMAGTLASFLFFQISAILRGAGDSTTPLIFLLVSTVLNIIWDPLLIFGIGPFPKMGVAGAAAATIAAQVVAAVFAVIHLVRQDGPLHLSFKGFTVDWRIIWDIVRLGIPSGIQQTVVALGGSVVVRTVASFGTMSLAVYSIGTKVDSFAFMPSMSLSIAVAAMAGQNIGAGREDRVRQVAKAGLALTLGIVAVFSALVSLFPNLMTGIFTNDRAVFGPAAVYVRTLAPAYLFFGVILTYGGIFRGTGAVVAPMLISVMSLWLIRVPMAILFARVLHMGPPGIWLAITLSSLVGAVASVIYYLRGAWANKALVHQAGESEEPLPEYELV